MYDTVKSEKIPIKIWAEAVDPQAMQQIKNIANLPFAFHHVAVMPDVHSGYGMPIGGVLAARGHVIPHAVGVDIGCGMCAVETSLQELSRETLKKIVGTIRATVPVGFKHHNTPHKQSMPQADVLPAGVVERQYRSAIFQIGTLGGGNHFIEIQHGSDGHIWIMVHSGSRNLGKQVADHYDLVAKKLNAQWGKALPKGYDLAFLPLDSSPAQDYLTEMDFCLAFARANRALMMEFVQGAFRLCTSAEFSGPIDVHHNYASQEKHFNKSVVIHRKGATAAYDGQLGIIPGSQGTKSYIVRGRGNAESFMSCSHGAGRRMGRKEATRKLDFKTETERLTSDGILHSLRHHRDLDEAPGAYKDIHSVMRCQEDLVEIEVELSPLAVIKG
jgi:tRNA-splicing ligase RtcB (3'-phosphate/5'-hydroxy nucleic acid ligase)